MVFRLLQYTLFSTLLFAVLSSVYKFKRIDTPSKILSACLLIGLFTEIIAYCMARTIHYNVIVYATYSLIEYCMYVAYFHYLNSPLTTTKAMVMGIAGVLFWSSEILFINHFKNVNSNFLLFEGLMVIGLSLGTFISWQRNEDFLYVHRYPHFWFVCLLVIFWTITYLSWGVNYYLNKNVQELGFIINYTLLIVNIITYLGIGVVFLLYSKMKVHD